jgi:hypothetical protein
MPERIREGISEWIPEERGLGTMLGEVGQT